MKKLLRFLLPAGLVSIAIAQNTAPTPSPPAAPPALADPAIGAPKTGDQRFLEMHEKFLARGKAGPIGVLFLGDSITEDWAKAPHIWKRYFGKYQPANFGLSGDRTQHVIWRIENGELDGLSPRVVVLMIGTNNAPEHSGAQIAEAAGKIVKLIRAKLPQTKILLLAIFPRGAHRNRAGVLVDDGIGSMAAITAANAGLAKLDDGRMVRFLDINTRFLGRDGSIPRSLMPDQLHPSAAGYQRWAEALEKPLAEMMQ